MCRAVLLHNPLNEVPRSSLQVVVEGEDEGEGADEGQGQS